MGLNFLFKIYLVQDLQAGLDGTLFRNGDCYERFMRAGHSSLSMIFTIFLFSYYSFEELGSPMGLNFSFRELFGAGLTGRTGWNTVQEW